MFSTSSSLCPESTCSRKRYIRQQSPQLPSFGRPCWKRKIRQICSLKRKAQGGAVHQQVTFLFGRCNYGLGSEEFSHPTQKQQTHPSTSRLLRHAKTLMFAHVSPEEDSFSETISTLKFAQRASTVELGAARVNKERSEIESLKKALANKESQNVQLNKTCEKPRAMTERTPPRPRRLSIEKCSMVKNENEMSLDDRKGSKTPSVLNRSRRSSLEGPTSLKKDDLGINVPDNMCRPKAMLTQKYGLAQEAEAATKSFGNFSSITQIPSLQLLKEPRSPTSAAYQKRVKMDSRSQIPSFQPPKTPELQINFKNEVQFLMQNELIFSTDYQTPNVITTANGKGSSQIRRSLGTIGKLINGSKKRSNVNGGKSPVTTNSKASRRQSVTSIQASGSDKNRRSSLGGKTADNNYAKDTRNAKTPPPMRQATKLIRRWS